MPGKSASKLRPVRTMPALPPRPKDAHKGTFGRVLVLSGSTGMIGAPSLVANAALRSGAGLVTVAVPGSIQSAVATLCPCATSIPLPETNTGQIDPLNARAALQGRGMFDVEDGGSAPDVLITGPGVGQGPQEYAARFWELINVFRNDARIPAIIDADALNLTSQAEEGSAADWDGQPHFRTVITPHPGELARMHGTGTREVQADREGYAVRTARMMAGGAADTDYIPVVVLKGAGTIVTDGTRLYVNRTGNPGMATGGTGDVLAGVIGALIGQGMSCFDAAVAGVYIHGLAGDLAARGLGMISLIATDLIDALPSAFLKHSGPRKPNR